MKKLLLISLFFFPTFVFSQFFVEYSTGYDISLNGFKEPYEISSLDDYQITREPFLQQIQDPYGKYFIYLPTGEGIVNYLFSGYNINKYFNVKLGFGANLNNLNFNTLNLKNAYVMFENTDERGTINTEDYYYLYQKGQKQVTYNIYSINPVIGLHYPFKNIKLGANVGLLLSFIDLKIHKDVYRFGFNKGSEKDDEITGVTGSHYTTFYRELDTRVVRWWTIDPKTSLTPWESPYTSMGNNPIWFNDPLGDIASTHTDEKGNVIAVYDDGDLGVYKHKGNREEAIKEVNKNYSASNTGAGGVKMGETITWDSFTDYDAGTPVGNISFGSNEAADFLQSLQANINHYKSNYGENAALLLYAYNAGNDDKFDFKSKADDIYRGSSINYEHGNRKVYMSARDVGNYGAGMAAEMCNQDKLSYMLTAGAFQQSSNSKIGFLLNINSLKKGVMDNYPSYGEHPRSNQAQRLGYEGIKTNKEYTKRHSEVWSDR